MQINDIVELEIEKLDHQGRGIAKKDGKVFFVSNGLPGEKLLVEIDKIKKNIVNAHIKKFINISKDRTKSICKYFDKCGGCDLLHLSYNHQIAFKENKIKEIMTKFCNYNFKINPIMKSDRILNYRNKVTFQIDNKLGFYERGSNTIVPVNNCQIINIKVNDLLRIINEDDIAKNISNIIIRSNINDEILLIVETKGTFDKYKFSTLVSNYVNSLIIDNEVIFGAGKIMEQLGKYKFIISPSSFFQVNTIQTINLYNKIKEYANLNKEDILLDLYCGTGTIGIYLSEECKKVIGIEINQSAIRDANENKKINKINNIDFICGDALQEIKKINLKPDVIVIDPPRAGLDKKNIDNILQFNASRIVYVSCDPITLTRDLNILGKDYNILELTPVDMFPNTCHVECVSVLHRKKLEK